jgi:hypothetical protein
MPWDANWASTGATGKLPLNALTQLRAALAERASGITSAPTLPAVPASGTLPNTWFSTFQAAVTSLIAKYANHTLSWVDGMALTSIAWTESTMLAAIGAGSRIAAPGTGNLVAAWALQQYKIINMLRWGGATISATAGPTERRTGTGSDNTGATNAEKMSNAYSAAVTAYNAAAWASSAATGPVTALSLWMDGADGKAAINNYRAAFQFSHGGCTPQATVMAVAEPTPYVTYTFASPDGYAVNTFRLFASGGEQTITNGTNYTEVMTQSIQALPGTVIEDNWACWLDDDYAILQFDGPNGFVYKDW